MKSIVILLNTTDSVKNFVSVISKYDFAEACEYFDMCTRYLVAYGFHKDIILEQIMDPYSISFLTSPYIILISASLQYCDIGKLKIKEGINNEAIYQIC